MEINNPIVLTMTQEQIDSVWKSCEQCQKALAESNGEDWGAAAGADPGTVSCPYCKAEHWAIGSIHQCSQCSGVYPVNWWPMYSYGVGSSRRPRKKDSLVELHNRRMLHPAYKHGYENPVESAWEERRNQLWGEIFKENFSDKETALRWLETQKRPTKELSEKQKQPFEFMMQAIKAIREKHPKRENARGIIACPKCGNDLGYTVARLNGHIWGQCKTENCLSWMM